MDRELDHANTPFWSPCGIHPKNESQAVNERTIIMGNLLKRFSRQRLDEPTVPSSSRYGLPLIYQSYDPKAVCHANGPLPDHLIPVWVESHVSSGFDNWRTCVKRTTYADGVRKCGSVEPGHSHSCCIADRRQVDGKWNFFVRHVEMW